MKDPDDDRNVLYLDCVYINILPLICVLQDAGIEKNRIEYPSVLFLTTAYKSKIVSKIKFELQNKKVLQNSHSNSSITLDLKFKKHLSTMMLQSYVTLDKRIRPL